MAHAIVSSMWEYWESDECMRIITAKTYGSFIIATKEIHLIKLPGESAPLFQHPQSYFPSKQNLHR